MAHYYIICVRHGFFFFFLPCLTKSVEAIVLFGRSFLKDLYVIPQLALKIV